MRFVRRTPRPAHGYRPHFEPLEPRVLLDGEGIVTGYDAYFTLSFAPMAPTRPARPRHSTPDWRPLAMRVPGKR